MPTAQWRAGPSSPILTLVEATLVTLLLASCGGSPEPTGPEPIARIEVSAPTNTVTVGATLQLTAVARDANGNSLPDRPVTWSSSDPTVLTLASTGLATAIAAGGPVTVTAASEGKSGTATITVVVASLELHASLAKLTAIDDTTRLTVTAKDANGQPTAPPPLTWASSSPNVLSVSTAGLVTARANGTATITGSAGPLSAEVVLTVEQSAAALSITGSYRLLRAVGASQRLSASVSDRNNHPIPGARIEWSSADPAIARIDTTGLVTTTGAGTVELLATNGSAVGRWLLEVVTRRHIPIDPYLATPIANAVWEVPVILVAYLPTADGVTIDTRKNPDFYTLGPLTLDSAEQRVLDYARRKKMMVEEGSRFHGYRDPAARPSLGYRVVDHIIVYELTPPSPTFRWVGIPGNPRFPDWFKIFADLDLAASINSRGVRELWFADSPFDAGFPSYDPKIHDPADFRVNFESNMASPTTGDISNSFRTPDDLPILNHTYILYGINYRRSQAEAVHNVGHQLEAMLSHASQLQDGNTQLFWRQFVGQDAQNNFITGRAGWTHMPPNTTGNYDYLNATLVPADIEDWRPDGTGTKTPVNVDTWGKLVYPWPGGSSFGQRVESQWYTYWMQNFPGLGNRIPHGNRWMTNWWAFVADWDSAMRSGLGLHAGTVSATAGSAPSQGSVGHREAAVSAERWPVHPPLPPFRRPE